MLRILPSVNGRSIASLRPVNNMVLHALWRQRLCYQRAHRARLPAGDPASGTIAWDLDVRPSDATYLAERYKAPVFVDNAIWRDSTITYATFAAHEAEVSQTTDAASDAEDGEAEGESCSTAGGAAVSERTSAKSARAAAEAMLKASCDRAGVLCAPAPSAFVQCL
jgi:Domain of unknown function (DUF151)